MPQGPLFLARAVYRRRRLRDAARLLPVLGLLLVLLPALGHDTSEGHAGTAIYLFAIWALLILAAAVLAPSLMRADAEGGDHRDPGSAEPADAAQPVRPPDTTEAALVATRPKGKDTA